MIKVLIMTVLIFIGISGCSIIRDGTEPVSREETAQQQKISEHEKSAVKSFMLAFFPPKEEWPSPIRKFYLAFNMEEVIDPIRQRPDWTPLKNMPREMPQALIAIEDHEFYSHGAIAPEGIVRAALANINAGEVVQGGSTLTQQFVKNVFLSHEQSMERKIEEAILSLMLEENYSKDEILELYLNTTYFGAGADGIAQAARNYFGKAPSAMTLAESAVIAALPYAPSALNPLENPEGCKKRQLLVLNAMHKYGFISQSQYEEAKNETVYLQNGTSL